MKKEEAIFVLACFLIGVVLFFLSRPLVINTNWYVVSVAILLLLVAQEIRMELGVIRVSLKAFGVIFLLLFLTPESIALLSMLVLLKRGVDRLLPRRLAFEFLQFAVGKLMHKFSPTDYMAPLLFAVGYFLTNSVLNFLNVIFFSKALGLNYLSSFVLSFSLGVFSSLLLTPLYLANHASAGLLFLTTSIYAGFVLLFYQVFKAERWRRELTVDKQKIMWETEHMMELPNVFDSAPGDENEAFSRILKLACEMMGFNYALLNVFDLTERKVVRIAAHGIPMDAFERLKENAPRVNEALALLQQRFDVGGAYFIPKGSVDISVNYVYTPSDYSKFDVDNAWDPDDLFLVPLLHRGRTIGYISLDGPKNGLRPTKREVEVAKFFAWLVSMRLLKSRYSLLFSAEVEEEVSVSKFWNHVSNLASKGRSFVVLMMDIDGFENFNQVHGFDVGDRVLESLKSAVSRALKGLGIFCSTGDEFYVLLETSSKTDGLLFAESVLSDLRSEFKNISVSSSVAKFPLDGSSAAELIQKLRNAMKTVKKSGGGRIIGA